MIDYLNNVESEYNGIQSTQRTAAMINHMILRHLYHFLPEESDKLGCHAGVIQVTLNLTHDNSWVVGCRILTFHVADPTVGFPASHRLCQLTTFLSCMLTKSTLLCRLELAQPIASSNIASCHLHNH